MNTEETECPHPKESQYEHVVEYSGGVLAVVCGKCGDFLRDSEKV